MADPIPYREGELAPSEKHILARLHKEDGSEPEMVWIDPQDVHKAPFRHEEIDALLPMLRWQWRHLNEYVDWCRSFEDWELNFLRDSNPVGEVVIWTGVTYALLEFTHRNPQAIKKGVFGALVCIVNGREDRVSPESVAAELKTLLNGIPAIRDLDNYSEDGHFKAAEKHLR
ncbi:hypothetical protein [Bythopirellula polymerisocia]|uniref:Uncharacterized protein n=1 Tax=Bythopirellula polymerisocia TaxID=2528003 RepID=A0A5C6CAC2_9BACT|nr:hypothetical protein [Bythopirellula polymerisocia]TWU20326.1 hypothetical protein Pla144_49730 [Bythopirellula polymerisocia]